MQDRDSDDRNHSYIDRICISYRRTPQEEIEFKERCLSSTYKYDFDNFFLPSLHVLREIREVGKIGDILVAIIGLTVSLALLPVTLAYQIISRARMRRKLRLELRKLRCEMLA
ncbi:hypothetical protein VIBR0546_02559 [Vibrio brasiliensis LMG 20546]|uniref:Uncharacterized protein n=1 Tax=Vibrio brasiliensis LMG 20546 TaxID=945543 RepID=E8LYR8_9VIBR|nr:hypothetical protein VIBR0546_02559 [Vibrio brasiliensis LMG 20546]